MKAVALLLLLALVFGAAGCGRASVSDDDDDLAGNASAGLALKAPNDAVQVAFGQRSYAAGNEAVLQLRGSRAGLRLRLFRAGAGHDGPLEGSPVSGWTALRGRPHTVRVRVGPWPSGLYYAQVVTPGRGSWFAPFVLRPTRPARDRVLVVLPTNTWQAYNFEDRDSWYFDSSVHTVELDRPYLDGGVPPHYRGYDRGFIRWLALHHEQPDMISDDDLDRIASPATLALDYDLVIFSGHEEYVTEHEFDLIEGYRDLGGNLAFLSANDFFYKVVRQGDAIDGRWRWRDLGRPESALVGAQYIDWNHDEYANRPYTVTGVAGAPWLFAGTGLDDGSRFGVYGIEVDAVTPESPPGTRVLAQIPDIFGPGETAEMTYYTTSRGAKVFSAGVMNFGGSSLWPVVSTMMENLWAKLTPALTRRRALAAALVLVAIAAALLAAYVRLRPKRAPTILGSTTAQYTPAPPRPKPPRPTEPGIAWGTYGYDQERTRTVVLPGLRPPFRRLWTFHGHSLLEFPPVVGYGRVYITNFEGRLFSLDARTGKAVWEYRSGRCGWASPALDDHLVFETFIGSSECHSSKGDGIVAAFDARAGRRRWLRRIGPTESSPLVAHGLVVVGDWNGRVWAFDERTGRTRWTAQLDGAIKGSLALSGRRLFIGTYAGELASLSLATGRLLWRSDGHGSFYSSPAVAYGRVYIGSLDGGVYAFGAGTGDLLWSRPTGRYVYASPAVWRELVLVGSYDHTFYALDAGTGAVRWRYTTGAPISGAATVVDGIVYFSSFDERTYALAAGSGHLVWSWRDGKYSPAVAGAGRLYLVGLGRVYALAPR